MAQIVQTREALDSLVETIQQVPYEVFCMQDINKLAFPIIAKWLLVDPGHVYLVPFDASDLLDFYEVMAETITGTQRPGIEGYDYAEAESEETIEGTGAATQTTFDSLLEQDPDSEVRPTSV